MLKIFDLEIIFSGIVVIDSFMVFTASVVFFIKWTKYQSIYGFITEITSLVSNIVIVCVFVRSVGYLIA